MKAVIRPKVLAVAISIVVILVIYAVIWALRTEFPVRITIKRTTELVKVKENPLADAIDAGESLSQIKTLISANPEYLKDFDRDGLPAVHFAVLSHRADLVRLFAAMGADVNARIEKQRSNAREPPIAFADELEVMRALVECGANTNYIDPYGRNLIERARNLGREDIAIYLENLARHPATNPTSRNS